MRLGTSSSPRTNTDAHRLKQISIPVWFHGQQIGDFRADFLVDGKVKLKTGRTIDASYEKQLLNYFRATDIEVGILFNFGPKAEFKRYIFENEMKNPRKSAQIRGGEVS